MGPSQFDTYSAPGDWALEPMTRASAHIETWRINAQNMTKIAGAVYGPGRTSERLHAVEGIRSLHVREPHKYTMPFIRNAWNTLKHRRAQEIKEITNVLRLRARVDRPTYDQPKSIGATIDPNADRTIFQRPDVFNVRDVVGYFQTEIARKMNAVKELADWLRYHNTPVWQIHTRTGAVPVPLELPGPPMTPEERRLAGTSSPLDKNGRKIGRDFDSHRGCISTEREHSGEIYKNLKQLSWSMCISLAKRRISNRTKRYQTTKFWTQYVIYADKQPMKIDKT